MVTKMEIIKTIVPLFGVLVGWLLSERAKVFADKRQDKRKLRKLLFFLLELRYHFAKELSTELDIDKYLKIFSTTLSKKLNTEVDLLAGQPIPYDVKPFILELLQKATVKGRDDKFEYLSTNIDKILMDLAEIDPLLAFELNGRHNIKERLSRANELYSEMEEFATSQNEQIPFDLRQFFNPKLTKELLEDLDESIEKIAGKIGRKLVSEVKKKIAIMDSNDGEDEKIGQAINEYLNKVIDTLNPE